MRRHFDWHQVRVSGSGTINIRGKRYRLPRVSPFTSWVGRRIMVGFGRLAVMMVCGPAPDAAMYEVQIAEEVAHA